MGCCFLFFLPFSGPLFLHMICCAVWNKETEFIFLNMRPLSGIDIIQALTPQIPNLPNVRFSNPALLMWLRKRFVYFNLYSPKGGPPPFGSCLIPLGCQWWIISSSSLVSSLWTIKWNIDHRVNSLPRCDTVSE